MQTFNCTDSADEPAAAVWLQGNRRLTGLLGAVATGLLITALGVGLLGRVAGALTLLSGLSVAGLAAGALAAAAGSWLAARPRLLRQGDSLLARLGPLRVDQLPLAAVEAVFLGSRPLDGRGRPACADAAAFRVGTLVVRMAERAVSQAGWAGRGPWACWEDGYLVIDGRWTEPLTAETVRRVNGRLIQAKRAAGAGPVGGASAAGDCCR